MAQSIGVNTGVFFVGEIVAENEIAAKSGPESASQAQRTEFIGTFDDSGAGDIDSMQFKVLLQDNRVVTVRGHGLRYLQNPSNPSDLGSYAILSRNHQEEVLVALFRVSAVTGIFTGGLEAARASA
jgi:hypothetical protein